MWGWITTRRVAGAVLALWTLAVSSAGAETPVVCFAEHDQESAARVLNELHAAAARADGAAYFALFAPNAVFIGTDAGERWSLEAFKAYAEPVFKQGRGWTYRPRARTISFPPENCPRVAWFDELLDSESYGTSRGTGVLLRDKEDWMVVQYSLSFPIPNAIAKEVTARVKAHEAAAKPSP